jgi:Tol biopolymer transport system component
MSRRGLALIAAAALASGAALAQKPGGPPQAGPAVIRPGETHLRNLRQLTSGGENAEGYWSPDGRRIIYQHRNEAEGVKCDQEYILDVATGKSRMVSTGKGRVTCGYFYDGGRRVFYATTHLADPACPPPPDYSKGYVWPMYAAYDIVAAKDDGTDVRRLTSTPGYDAEGTLSPDGRTIVFTSVRDGDLEIYTMSTEGTNVRRLTHEPGYDGGPFFSPDGTRVVYRRDSYADESGLARYRELLAQHLYQPRVLEIWVMDCDGSNKRQVTRLGAASFAPYFHPDGRRILFASNHPDPRGRNFDLYMIRDDGSGLERITDEPTFDGFPMFSPDGRQLVFASNRGGRTAGETNLFLVDWVE